jgi:glutamate/tyrosine decarboxylase-like PLP-dependent enzyme
MDERLRRDRDDLPRILERARAEAVAYLKPLDRRQVAVDPGEPETATLPETGLGAEGALTRFRERWEPLMSASPGPRYFGFVTGGATPAALAGDWLASAYDQNAQRNGDTGAPFLELETVGFLRDLFGLPAAFSGAFLTGATVSNFVGLAIARQVLGRRLGADVADAGLWGLLRVPVLSAAAHSSVGKALAMAGMGRASLVAVPRLPGREAVDPAALEERLAALDGAPAVVVANAGTVNTTDFDDFQALARLKERHGFWLHVDGAFGLLAAASPRFRHLLAGVEAADSITVDGHKWLNVPYDSALVFTRHLEAQLEVFQNLSPYLGRPEPIENHYLHLVPENSRRLRALAAWMSLVAYGREGHREIVERCADLAGELGRRIAASDALELLAPVRLNVVCFTLRGAAGEAGSDAVRRFLAAIQADGRAYLTGTVYDGRPAVRAAFSNWRTERRDVEITFEALLAAARSG